MKVKYVFCFVLLIVVKSMGLEVHQSVTDNNILETASAIKNVTNEIFLAFKLKGVKKNEKLRQYSLIHNFFSTITLKDHTTLNLVSKASRFDTTDVSNETHSLIDTINEILNEDPTKTIDGSNKDHLNDYVDEFLTKLEQLKDTNGVNNNNLEINNQLLSILSKERYNVTKEGDLEENDSLLSDNEFWVPEEKSGRRIYQGDRTKIKYFPFMASVQIFNSFQCGGSIIKSDLVITAASCVQLAWNNRFFRENPSFLSVRVGSNFYKGGGESIAVLEVYFHPDYNPKTLKNNICLLRLIRRIKFRRKSKVKKIDFDRSSSTLPMNTDGITIVGWGAKGSSNIIQDPWKNQLSFAVLDIYPLRECQDIYSKQYVTQKNFCAGFFSKGGGACNGDVGGPGIVNGILAGIVSFGSPVCGTPDAPTVFTKLGYYTDWIENIMEQEVPNTNYRTTLKTSPAPATLAKYNTLVPTTFVLEPVDSKWRPPFINAVELGPSYLRLLDDEDLFKEFLSTFFGSKEAKEYEELFDTATEKEIKREKKVKPSKDKLRPPKLQQDEGIEFVTKTFEHTTPNSRFTALDEIKLKEKSKEASSDDDAEIERNILKLIENIDISDNEDAQEPNKVDSNNAKEIRKGFSENDVLELLLNADGNIPQNEENEMTDLSQKKALEILLDGDIKPREKETEIGDVSVKDSLDLVLDDDDITKGGSLMKNIDDSILTLLYLSDNETNNNPIKSINKVIEDFDENVDEGLSIALDGFKDLTFRNNGTGSVYNFLPKDEMYELLAEAIDDVAKNKE